MGYGIQRISCVCGWLYESSGKFLYRKSKYKHRVTGMHVKLFLSGLEKKKMNISLPLGQVALKVCLLWASLAQSFNDLVGRRLAWSLAHWACEIEKLLAQKKSRLVRGNGTAFEEPCQVCVKVIHWNRTYTDIFVKLCLLIVYMYITGILKWRIPMSVSEQQHLVYTQ